MGETYGGSMRLSPSQLGAAICTLIDRNGTILRLVPPRPESWLDRLPRREGVVQGDPEELVHIDWSADPRT
jgi:hypothetical protein